ncbi:MAG: hypothetical protein RIS52_1371 [Pseudomonadota bacterium]
MRTGLALGVAMLLALGSFAAAQTPASSPAEVPVSSQPASPIVTQNIVETGQDQSHRLTVPVMINGQGPFQFVIDTGADRTAISSELAAKLGLPNAGKTRLHAMHGVGDVKMVKISTLEVSTNKKTNIKAAALPLKYLGADGLLGVDSLEGLRITLDFETAQMFAEPSIAPPRPVLPNTREIVVSARSQLGQLIMVDAEAEGQKIWVVVDTGSQISVGNSKLRRLLNKTQATRKMTPISLVDVLGEKVQVDYTLVDRIRLGGVKLEHAAVAFRDVHPFKLFNLQRRPAMLLGMENLSSFRRVTIDFAKRRITFILPR